MDVNAQRIVVVEQAASRPSAISTMTSTLARHPLMAATFDADALTMFAAAQIASRRVPTHGCEQTLLWSANAAY